MGDKLPKTDVETPRVRTVVTSRTKGWLKVRAMTQTPKPPKQETT
jgi:hypothetical protein